jgi:hypothetical protein
MSGAGLLERVKGWFGGKESFVSGGGLPMKRLSLEPVHGGPGADFSGTSATVTDVEAPESAPDETAADLPLAEHLDPLDPTWLVVLEDLPRRITEATAENTTIARILEQIRHELEGHREVSRAVGEAICRMPELGTTQVALLGETNKMLGRQCRLAEAMLDGVTDLRAALENGEESSRRNLLAIEQLETVHRQVLQTYQGILLKSYRRLGRLSALAVFLAAAAIGGAGYIAYLVLAAR